MTNPKITSIEKQAILSMGAIRYVPISSTEGFYIFKYPGTNLEYGQSLGEIYEGRDVLIWDVFGFISKRHRMNACYIFHNDKLIYRESNNAIFLKERFIQEGFGDILDKWVKDGLLKEISSKHVEAVCDFDDLLHPEFYPESFNFDNDIQRFNNILDEAPRGEIDYNYLFKYREQIKNAPEFYLENMFTAKMTAQDMSGTPGQIAMEKEVDYLIPRPEVKPPTFPEWKQVRKLLIRFGLLKEKRGKVKPIDTTTKVLRAFVLKEYKLIGRKKPLPLKTLRSRLIDKVNKLFPDDEKKAEKYYMSESTIRRLIESSIKK